MPSKNIVRQEFLGGLLKSYKELHNNLISNLFSIQLALIEFDCTIQSREFIN